MIFAIIDGIINITFCAVIVRHQPSAQLEWRANSRLHHPRWTIHQLLYLLEHFFVLKLLFCEWDFVDRWQILPALPPLTTVEGAKFNLVCFYFSLQLDNYEIRPGKRIKVNVSIAKVRLFVGNIPKQRSKDDIYKEFSKVSGEPKRFFELQFCCCVPSCDISIASLNSSVCHNCMNKSLCCNCVNLGELFVELRQLCFSVRLSLKVFKPNKNGNLRVLK